MNEADWLAAAGYAVALLGGGTSATAMCVLVWRRGRARPAGKGGRGQAT
jgi:hypothetical protein